MLIVRGQGRVQAGAGVKWCRVRPNTMVPFWSGWKLPNCARAHGGEYCTASSSQLGEGVDSLSLSPSDLGCRQTHPPLPTRSLPEAQQFESIKRGRSPSTSAPLKMTA